MISKQSRMTSHRMLIHVATEILIKTYYPWDDSISDGMPGLTLSSAHFCIVYRISSGFIDHRFIDHRFLLKTSYWYQVSWFVETLVTCKFFIHRYIVKLKSMSYAYISLAGSSLFNEKSQLGFYGLQSELTEVLIVDFFLLQRLLVNELYTTIRHI